MDTNTTKSKRLPIPLLHQFRKHISPRPLVSLSGESRPLFENYGFTTIKRKWGITYSIISLFIVVALIYGAALGASGILLYMITGACLFLGGEMIYSRLLCEYLFQVQSSEPVPCKESFNKHHIDYHETETHIVAGHHFVSVAGAAPIVGPAQAVYFGWLPCILWVILGSIFCGSPADMGAAILGSRNNGKSIADLAGLTISKRSGFIFVMMLIVLCWLIVAVFANLIAGLWMDYSSSVLPINLEIFIAIGLSFLWKKFPSGKMHLVSSLIVLIGLYLVIFFSVWLTDVAGDPFKFDWLGCRNSILPDAECSFGEQQLWTLWIGIYVTIVSAIPVWMVLQPRDTINSHQLILLMFLTVIGIIIGGAKLTFPSIRSNLSPDVPIFPYLFVTIACGAISGFHSIVASVSTSKQITKMTSTRSIGYGSMLLESCLATLSIVVVCSTANEGKSFATWSDAGRDGMTNFVEGCAIYFNKFGFPVETARTIVSVMVISFAATTIDTCARTIRMLLFEFTNYVQTSLNIIEDYGNYRPNLNVFQKFIKSLSLVVRNPIIGSLFAVVPAIALCNTSVVNALWTLFGASNQVVAALSLLISGIYLVRLNKVFYKGLLYFLPFLFIAIICIYALILQIIDWIQLQSDPATYLFINYSVLVAAFFVLLITIWIILEAFLWMFKLVRSKNYQNEIEDSNFVSWNPKDNRTGYFRSAFPVGFETQPQSLEEPVKKSNDCSDANKKSLFQRIFADGKICC